MADIGAKAEGLHSLVPEELDLVVPIRDGSLPTCLGTLSALLVDKQILPNGEPS